MKCNSADGRYAKLLASIAKTPVLVIDDWGVEAQRREAIARVGERAFAVGGLLQHGGEVEARAQAQSRRAQGGDALAQNLDLVGELVAAFPSPSVRGRRARGPGGRSDVAWASLRISP